MPPASSIYTHAFFKALLFLGSGAVIHALGGEQDLRRMGGLKRDLPITYWTFLIGAMAIAGVPTSPVSSASDEVLYQICAGGHTLLWIVGLVTSLLTATYMFRLVFLAFHGRRREEPAADHGSHLHDAPPAMALALIVLAVGSIAAGYAGFPRALGGSNRFERFLEPSFTVRQGDVPSAGLQADVESAETATAAPKSGSWPSRPSSRWVDRTALLFLKNPRRRRGGESFCGLHRVLVNSYSSTNRHARSSNRSTLSLRTASERHRRPSI
jgi:NADH:ubiquinone oxidoreductase subunit 5 (subunit L)/multisubunit Na+/H+ antiporter MnhA subunit